MSYWQENAWSPGRHRLVDLGYVKHPAARRRADKMLRLVGRRNMEIAALGRILIRIPPRKIKLVLRTFPRIRPSAEAPGYAWCTDTWLCKGSRAVEMAWK